MVHDANENHVKVKRAHSISTLYYCAITSTIITSDEIKGQQRGFMLSSHSWFSISLPPLFQSSTIAPLSVSH